MSLALTSFFAIRYLSAEWSVNTVVLNLSRYCLKFSNAKIMAKISFSVVVQLSCVSFKVLLA